MGSNKLVKITKVPIRSRGFDEYWLQKEIWENPDLLGLGDNLQPVIREKQQSSGGRLDILMQDPDDDNALYEIEVMLGETDPSHIIRTIEYWDLERRRYPQKQHYAVLIAESFTKRFYNVIQLLSYHIPLIAIQVELLQFGDQSALNFVKVLDIYNEEALSLNADIVDEKYWRKHSKWTYDVASKVMGEISKLNIGATMNYTKSYISVMPNSYLSMTFGKRLEPNVRLEIINQAIIHNFTDFPKDKLSGNIKFIHISRNNIEPKFYCNQIYF